jgi:tetratricopeptide (TPR) repeat protein
MKKLLFSLLICLFVTTVFAQEEDKEITKQAKEAFKNAEKAFKKNDFNTAKVEIDNALKSQKVSSDPKTWLVRGQIYKSLAIVADSNNIAEIEPPLKEMITSFEKAVSLDNKYKLLYVDNELNNIWSVFFNRGVNAYNANNGNIAVNYFDKTDLIISKDSSALNNAFLLGMGLKDRDNKQYKAICNRILASPHFKDKSLAYYMLADITNRVDGKPEEALEIAKKGADAYPQSKDLMLVQVDLYQKLNKIPEAVASLEQALSRDPNNDYLYYVLGFFYQKLNNSDKAIEAYKKSVSLKPDNFDVIYELGAAYYNKGGAIGKLINNFSLEEQKAKEKDGSLKQMTDEMKNLYKESLPYFEKAVKIKPTDPNAIGALMSAANGSENYALALPYIENAIKEEPKNVEFLQHLSSIYNKTGKPEAAIPYYETALKGDDLNLELLEGLFNACKNAKKYQQAVPYIEKAANTLATEISLWENLSTLYFFMGEKAKAEAIEKKIEKLNKKN